jgi:hypothetical protein
LQFYDNAIFMLRRTQTFARMRDASAALFSHHHRASFMHTSTLTHSTLRPRVMRRLSTGLSIARDAKLGTMAVCNQRGFLHER